MSGTNSDTDSLSDYREIDVYSIKWNVSGDPILPTINQASGAYSYDGLERFKSEQWAAGMPSSAFEKRFDYILNNTYILPILSDPTTPDTDGDGLDDAQERELGTDPFTIDTDRDLVDDGFELMLLYDPTNANPDGDEYNDREEYFRCSDPYTYEVEVEIKDPSGQFWKGVIFGDFVEDEEVDGYVLIGQIAGGFVPIVADGRDVIANVYKGNILMAILSGVAFCPGAGDALKILGDLGQMIIKLGDDMPAIVKLLIKTADEHPHLVKLFGQNDDVAEAIRKAAVSPQITGENLDAILKYADEAGIVLERASDVYNGAENVIDSGQAAWKYGWAKRGKILDEAANHHSTGEGLGEFFPGADRLDEIDGVDTLISTKSIDLRGKTYRDPEKLKKRIQAYLDKFAEFEDDYPDVKTTGIPYGENQRLTINQYEKKQIELIIPDIPLSTGQKEVLDGFINNKDIIIRVARG